MNKAALIEAIADRLGANKTAAGKALDAVLDEIVVQVADGEKVVIAGFGTFEPAFRPARTARNPQTGDSVDVPAKIAPMFKAGAAFKAAVNK